MELNIEKRVHDLYWKEDINCARTMLICLSERYELDLLEQTLEAAIGLHGAGGFRAQCGLVEGALMFVGIYCRGKECSDAEIAGLCYRFANEFLEHFGSLQCYDLRPNGFQESDPPHACEELTVNAVRFSIGFIENYEKETYDKDGTKEV